MSYYDTKFPEGFYLQKFTRRDIIELAVINPLLHSALEGWRSGAFTWEELMTTIVAYFIDKDNQERLKECAESKAWNDELWSN